MAAEGQNQIMLLKDDKAPTTLEKDSLSLSKIEKENYDLGGIYLKVSQEKHAPAVFKTLTGEAKGTILNMGIEANFQNNG